MHDGGTDVNKYPFISLFNFPTKLQFISSHQNLRQVSFIGCLMAKQKSILKFA